MNYTVEVYEKGTTFWYKEGTDILHRLNGPAIEHAFGANRWFIEGVEYTEEEFNKKIQQTNSSCDGRIVTIDEVKYKLVKV